MSLPSWSSWYTLPGTSRGGATVSRCFAIVRTIRQSQRGHTRQFPDRGVADRSFAAKAGVLSSTGVSFRPSLSTVTSFREGSSRAEVAASLSLPNRFGEARCRNESLPKGKRSRELRGLTRDGGGQRQANDRCPRGRMPLRSQPGGSGQWWGGLLVLRECASGLPREA